MPYIQLEKYYSTLINPKRNRRRKAIKAAGGIRQFKRQRSEEIEGNRSSFR